VNAPGKKWSEEETKLALFLYFQLPFGQLHSGNPEIQKLADTLGRTHSSVAMKLCNFASLDPKITESGRRGLQGASVQDKRIWEQFRSDWTGHVEEAERIWKTTDEAEDGHTSRLRDSVLPFAFEPYEGPSTAQSTVERRVGQGFFRRSVFANFDNRCCITGIEESALLNASHIVPWGLNVRNRHNPANGLCLSATFDRAFDRGLITLDDTYAVVVSKSLLKHDSAKTREYFARYDGNLILPPARFDPDPTFLNWRQNERFVDAQ
jgi:putative restriction endonuclease